MTGNSSDENYEDIYKERLEVGLEYQDFATRVLFKSGFIVSNYGSRKYQFEYGENEVGIEIKFDRKFSETGNLWIEIAEKKDPGSPEYRDSGIYRNDNSWLYLIGDYKEMYLFSKKMLQLLRQSYRYKIHSNGTDTSRGFLLSKKEATKFAARVIQIHL